MRPLRQTNGKCAIKKGKKEKKRCKLKEVKSSKKSAELALFSAGLFTQPHVHYHPGFQPDAVCGFISDMQFIWKKLFIDIPHDHNSIQVSDQLPAGLSSFITI